jgi:uncharacterized Zn-finger protein
MSSTKSSSPQTVDLNAQLPVDGVKAGRGGHQTAAKTTADSIPISSGSAHETVSVSSRSISCNGGGGALGHPLVYLMIGADGWRDCGYCGRRFVLATGNR